METNIQKWGNSLGVRLPKSVVEQKSLKEGSRVVVVASATGIHIAAVSPDRSFRLADILKGISPSNLHAEIEWGSPQGNEVW